ncbi:MAG: hypothetical protein QME49_09820 [bacterium]|nr:hypothetical protein [bacterium]
MLKPCNRDIKVNILIAGKEFEELQKHTWSMAESFGLDGRIDDYKGKKPIGLYRWDIECLLDVLSMALDDPKEYPFEGSREYEITQGLYQRLKQIYDSTYEK